MDAIKPAEEACSPEAVAARKKSLILGPLLMCSSALSLALVASLIKWASQGFSTEFILAMRYGVSLFILLALHSKDFLDHLAAVLRPSLLMLQAVCYVSATFVFYLSIRYVPLVDAFLLVNSATFFAPLFSWLIFKKPERPLVWLGIAIGMTGVALVLRPGAEGFRAAGLLALAAGALGGMQFAINAKIIESEGKDRIAVAVQFYGVVMAGIATLFVGVDVADWQQMLFSKPEWAKPWLEIPTLAAAALAAGGLSMLIAMLSASAYKFGSVGQITPFVYTSIIFSGLIGWLIWGTVPTLLTLLGFVLIVSGGIGALLGGRQPQPHETCQV